MIWFKIRPHEVPLEKEGYWAIIKSISASDGLTFMGRIRKPDGKILRQDAGAKRTNFWDSIGNARDKLPEFNMAGRSVEFEELKAVADFLHQTRV